ncbi:MAG: hypothetical protein ABJE66_25870 [Deltaproteobacteria bacterium]
MSEELYREAQFVERCFCEAPAAEHCECCHQPRCAAHLEEGLCTRCTQAVSRFVRRRGGTAWLIGGASGVVATLVLLPLTPATAVFVGISTAIGAAIGSLRHARKHAIEKLGRQIPLRGELPAEVEDRSEPNSGEGMPPGGYG